IGPSSPVLLVMPFGSSERTLTERHYRFGGLFSFKPFGPDPDRGTLCEFCAGFTPVARRPA
ncbi:hypothetical protein, partial [Burkholderia perseverans]|uniref:hypothetical protein n=1 Tax=Burkholderia perseverans TaxID=2615214 RepID=UPI001FED3DE7